MNNSQLVYDVGANVGQDIARYLAGDFQIVAIEADPTLAAGLERDYAEAIASKRLKVVNCAVSDQDGERDFFLSENSLWNSFDEQMATREGRKAKRTKVHCRTFRSLVKEYGTPHYVKCDIEGADRYCVLGIEADCRPKFVSWEAGDDAMELADHLSRIGFGQWRIVDQRGWRDVTVPMPGSAAHVAWSARQFVRLKLRSMSGLHSALKAVKKRTNAIGWHDDGSSGPVPVQTSAPAAAATLEVRAGMSIEDLRYTWRSMVSGGLIDSSWYDIHAVSA